MVNIIGPLFMYSSVQLKIALTDLSTAYEFLSLKSTLQKIYKCGVLFHQ